MLRSILFALTAAVIIWLLLPVHKSAPIPPAPTPVFQPAPAPVEVPVTTGITPTTPNWYAPVRKPRRRPQPPSATVRVAPPKPVRKPVTPTVVKPTPVAPPVVHPDWRTVVHPAPQLRPCEWPAWLPFFRGNDCI